MAEITRVAVVGAGTMGSQIALQTACAGRYEVARLEGGPGAPAALKQRVESGQLGRKTGRGFYDYTTTR